MLAGDKAKDAPRADALDDAREGDECDVITWPLASCRDFREKESEATIQCISCRSRRH